MNNQDPPQVTPRSVAEWISFSIALCLLGTLISLVIYTWAAIQDKPPLLTVKVKSDIRQEEKQYYIPFDATNIGGGTVKSVQVIAQLSIKGEIIETGQTKIDFLSSGEISSGVFIFSTNPIQGELIVRVASYQLP